jgi:hypothetical protein
MGTRFWRKGPARLGAMLLAAAALAVGWPGTVFGGSALSTAPNQAGDVTTVPLEYRETPYRSFIYDLLFRDVPVQLRSGPFAKEPAPPLGAVVRGVLKFGGGPSNAVSFVWQPGVQKLFLDLNRNHDLTDDAAGVFTGRITGPRIPTVNHQVFTNVHLRFPATSAGAPMLVDLNFFQYGAEALPNVNVMTRSYWRGKVAVAGHDWEVGLLQNVSEQPGSFARGQLLLRPWEQRDKAFIGWSDSQDAYAVPFEYRNRALKGADAFELTRRVFFEGHAWQLDWDAEPGSDPAPFAVRLTEERPALGELQITGQQVERVVMTGGPYAVVLSRPAGSVPVPVGSYNQPTLWLKQGEDQAYFNSLPKSGAPTEPDPRCGGVRPVWGVPEAGKVVVVGEHTPAVLAMGGPLTNTVVVSRHGRELKLTHHLIGAGGGEYKLWEYWRKKGDVPPQFVINKGDRQIASGKFAFG